MKRHFYTQKGPKAIGPYASAVIHGDTVYLSGMIPIDPETGTVAAGDIEAQTKRVMDNITLVLSELNLSLGNVIKSTIFLTDLSAFARVNAVYKNAFDEAGAGQSGYPARSCVQVSQLPLSVNIEIEVIVDGTAC